MNKYKQIKSEIGDVNECTTDVTIITKPKKNEKKRKEKEKKFFTYHVPLKMPIIFHLFDSIF